MVRASRRSTSRAQVLGQSCGHALATRSARARAVGGTLMRLGRRPQSVLAEARSDAHTYLPLAFVK